MNRQNIQEKIKQALVGFRGGDLEANAFTLFETLGYRSSRRMEGLALTAENLAESFDCSVNPRPEKALSAEWKSIHFLFQLTDDEINAAGLEPQLHMVFDSAARVDPTIYRSYLFFAIALQGSAYTRGQLAGITREINRLFSVPVMVLFQHGSTLTLAIIHRRPHKRETEKDVLEKVTLIKDIRLDNPHRAHLEILADLALPELYERQRFTNFLELHQAWQDTLNISLLNKRFYTELANWYFWAVKQVAFPPGPGEDEPNRNAVSVIRLITRLIFVWFIKEKGLVPETLFDHRKLGELLTFSDPQDSTYYKAILQNLFFATLNIEMGSGRRFRGKNQSGGMDAHHGISTVYRYEGYFKDPQAGLALFADIPFLNGGLFECLDKEIEKDGKREIQRVDGFSDRSDNPLRVPDALFFGERHREDLSYAFGDPRHDREEVRGLINILSSYKFTIEENTPIEEEIALDPELLGKVFENLLASYNPETGATARKQTGSFYTPREIVNYMVDEALVAYLETALAPEIASQSSLMTDRVRDLLSYNDAPHGFNEDETTDLISAIDRIKTLDPACGSGAFPMGVLHKLVFILNKLDPGNQRWKEKQIAKAAEIPDPAVRQKVMADIEQAFSGNELDYGRKLYLIENCIYGVDIQPIAVQIAKLRFFIALVVEQRVDPGKENLGIRPLPNLETKFVAANTLIGIERPQQMTLRNPEIDRKEKLLAEVRSALFTARTPATKRKYREKDAQLRGELAELLKKDGWGSIAAAQLAGWDPYDQNASAPFFDPEWMFGIVDGFDVIIGNPPYITIRSQDEYLKHYIRYNYSYSKGADIYVAFIENSLNKLRKLGTLTFIVPNKFFGADYGGAIRKYLQSGNAAIGSIWDLKDEKVFESALISTVVVVIHKGSYEKPVKLLQGDAVIELPTLFDADGKIQIEQNETGKPIVEKIYSHSKLEELADIRTGIMGFEYWKMEEIVEDGEPFKNFVKLYTNGNFGKYTSTWGKQPVDLYKNKYLKPIIKLDRHFLSQNTIDLFQTKPKIIVRGVSRRLAGIIDFEGSGLLVAVHSIIPKQVSWQYILGLLNSNLLNWYHLHTQYSIRIPQGSLKYPISFFKKLPIPMPNEKMSYCVVNIENLVNKVMALSETDPTTDISTLEAEIDRQVYTLYELTEEQIAVVEGRR